jgi:hypothetical protein
MFKLPQQSSPVTNVIQGQNAIHRFAPGPRYHQIRYIITALKTAATAGFTSAKLSDVIGVVLTKVNTKTVREALASQIDKMQTDWSSSLAVKAIDGIANDLQTAVADVVAGGNTARTTTIIFTTHFAEPCRDSYKARQAFALPTSWSNGKTVSVEQWLQVLATAGISNVVIRAEEVIDTVQGAYAKKLANGQYDTASAIVLPMTHFFRQPEIYTSTKLQIRDWSFSGVLQQLSIFGAGNGDNVAHVLLKADGVVKWDQDAATIDAMNQDYGWNFGNFTAAVKHLAMDFDDDPTSAFPFDAYKTVELTVTLSQATANSSLEIIAQVWRDALAS